MSIYKIVHQIEKYTTVSRDLKRELEMKVTIKHMKKKTILLKEEQICRHFNFINKGLVRSFYYYEGKDKTYWFYDQEQFFTSWYSFFLKQPSFEYLETLEDSEIASINYTDYQELAKKYPEFGLFARQFAEVECATIDYYTKSYMDISAKEKYIKLLSDIPNITSRVKLGHIASLLGISQETLSRIRAEKI